MRRTYIATLREVFPSDAQRLALAGTADISTERLLSHVQPLRGSGEMKLLGDRDEVPQQPDVQILGHAHLRRIRPRTATVRAPDGQDVLTDGPAAAYKEVLFAQDLIDVPDVETAVAWAAKLPRISYGSVETRQLLPAGFNHRPAARA